jgi:hypothetical protein
LPFFGGFWAEFLKPFQFLLKPAAVLLHDVHLNEAPRLARMLVKQLAPASQHRGQRMKHLTQQQMQQLNPMFAFTTSASRIALPMTS